jgi:hypothetical protein
MPNLRLFTHGNLDENKPIPPPPRPHEPSRTTTNENIVGRIILFWNLRFLIFTLTIVQSVFFRVMTACRLIGRF